MVKTPAKAKKSSDAIVPVEDKRRRAAPPSEDQRGAIVALLMTHEKLSYYRSVATGWLPAHGKSLTASDLQGVKAILDSNLDPQAAWEAFKGFFNTGATSARRK